MDSYAARNCLRLGLQDLAPTTLSLARNVSWEILGNPARLTAPALFCELEAPGQDGRP